MTQPSAPLAPSDDSRLLCDRTDFYAAWQRVNAESNYSPAIRARAFSLWVALFGCIDANGTVTRNSAELAAEFEVSRASWLQYRELLVQSGLIEQARVAHGTQRPTVVRVLPPLRNE